MVVFVSLLTPQFGCTQEPVLSAVARQGLQRYQKQIKPLLVNACFDCHSGEDVEGNFHFDQLDPDLAKGDDVAWWLEVYAAISKGEMPPDADDLPDDDRAAIVDWLSKEIQVAEKAKKASGQQSSFRRLTRYEYNYALQDLLGVPWTFSGDLPAESSEEGAFENNADSLRMSVKQVETYQQLAVKALQRITVRGEQPPKLHWAIPMKTAFEKRAKLREKQVQAAKAKFKDEPENQEKEVANQKEQFRALAAKTHYLDLATGDRESAHWHYIKAPNFTLHSDSNSPMPAVPGSHVAVVMPGGSQALTVELDGSLPDEGVLRVQVRASRSEGVVQRVPTLQLSFGFRSTDQGAAVKRVSKKDVRIEAAFGQPEIYQWDIPLSEIEHRNPYRGESKPGKRPSCSEYIKFTNNTFLGDDQNGESANVLIEHVQIVAPAYDQWPPAQHRNVFIDSENSEREGQENETAYAKEILGAFITRAWRRKPTADEVKRKLELFEQLRPNCDDFSDAIVEVLATVLTSPKFLYVLPSEEAVKEGVVTGRLSQNELATRLSLFLWCSLPDQTLLDLADAGRLNQVEVLEQQIERMLADSKAGRFHQHFVQQWLKMQPLEFLSPTKGKGKDESGLDAALLESMKQEPIALFADMLQRDSDLLEFIDADYSVVNERLAQHYGIAGVRGNHFRRVALPQAFNRGGLLTQASMLTMNSDGVDSHPVKRGVWLLTNLLNDPPPPPPAAVPEIDLSDPAILKMTLKERIENHREHAACLSCHQKIDPWGIAFENYDALGRWRTQINDRAVDAVSELPGEVSLDGVEGLKRHLVQERADQLVRATVEKMASYALGRQLDFGDRASVTEINKRVLDSGGGLKTLVFGVVTSDLFQTK